MLFILTGGVQIGKTRWLERLVGELHAKGVSCVGVLSPGVWRVAEESSGREKIGIDTVLLPSGERFRFAARRDLLETDGGGATSQSDKAKLGWAIFDEALARVNDSFAELTARPLERLAAPTADDRALGDSGFVEGAGSNASELLVVDEVGRLELEHGRGLDAALRVLDAGPVPCRQHALIVVRDWLADAAALRFEAVWGAPTVVGPDEAGRRAVLEAYDLA